MALSKTQATILALLSDDDAPTCVYEDRLIERAQHFGALLHFNTMKILRDKHLVATCTLHAHAFPCVQLTAKGDAALRRYRAKAVA